MSRVFNLSHVLQLIVDRLDYGSFSQQHFVGDAHQRVLHFVFKLGYQLNAVEEEFAEEILAYVTSVTDKFAVELLGEPFHLQGLAVIHIAWREHEVDDLAHLIADDVQLEPIEPPNRAVASLGETLECLVLEDALVLADPQWSAVDETYAGAFAHQDTFDQYGKFDNRTSFQLNETVVRHHFRKQMAHVPAHIMKIEVFQTSVPRIMKQYENSHDFRIRHHAIAMVLAFLGLLATCYGILFNSFVKNFAEIITH